MQGFAFGDDKIIKVIMRNPSYARIRNNQWRVIFYALIPFTYPKVNRVTCAKHNCIVNWLQSLLVVNMGNQSGFSLLICDLCHNRNFNNCMRHTSSDLNQNRPSEEVSFIEMAKLLPTRWAICIKSDYGFIMRNYLVDV